MGKRTFIPGERHHWWPRSVSQFWADTDGLIGCVDPSGNVYRSSPINTARISDGHNIKMGSPWDETFEDEFDKPDGNFPTLVQYLEDLVQQHEQGELTEQKGIHSHSVAEASLTMMCECVVSLAVRSPKFRNGIITFVEFVRSNVAKREHKILIAANMRSTYTETVESLTARGKYLVIFSDSDEFIFGDGFYNNVRTEPRYSHNTTIAAPITPNILLLYASPMEYLVEPRLMTLRADSELLRTLNDTIQIYAKDRLFFRSTVPALTEPFTRSEHLVYSRVDPIEHLVCRIPGVRSRETYWPPGV